MSNQIRGRVTRKIIVGAVALFIGTMLTLSGAWAADSAPSRMVEASAAPNKIAPRLLDGPTATPSVVTVLPPLADKEMLALQTRNERAKLQEIGIGRALPKSSASIGLDAITWTSSKDGTRYATVELQSTGASALRIAISRVGFPKGLTVIAYGTATPNLVYGPYQAEDLHANSSEMPNPFWLPVIEGDTARLELRLRSDADVTHKTLGIPMLSHLLTSIRDPLLKNLKDIGRSGSCNIDVACAPTTAPWVSRGKAVAKYYVTSAVGTTGICTGTLVSTNTSASPLPAYFITAHHCVSTQVDASSLHLYWFFERAMCGGAAPTTTTETTGGAALLSTGATNDMTLVLLNTMPPAGAIYSAWSSTTIVPGDSIAGLHHPSGDLKKYSAGSVQGFTDFLINTQNSNASHIKVQWSEGTTEAGSSGSGLFNSSGQLVGTLHGGDAACTTQTAPDWFGRFDQAYSAFSPWLSPSASGPPPTPAPPPPSITADLVSGTPIRGAVALDDVVWYRITSSATNTSLTVTLTALSADADLYLFRDAVVGTPSCSSELLNTTPETCTITTPGTATWYIAVSGYQAASFTVTATLASPAPAPAPATNNGGGGGELGSALLLLLALALQIKLFAINKARR